MIVGAVPGVTRVPVTSLDATTDALVEIMGRLRGDDAARDPGLSVAALEAAELAHSYRIALLAVVDHPSSDPALLVAGLVPTHRLLDADSVADLRHHLAEGPGIREVTRTTTATGHPVVVVERILADQTPSGAQLQALVVDTTRPQLAVFTLHSPTGRGWLDVAGVAGRLVAGTQFTADPTASAR